MKKLNFTINTARGQIGDEINFKIDVIDLIKSVKHQIKYTNVEVVFRTSSDSWDIYFPRCESKLCSWAQLNQISTWRIQKNEIQTFQQELLEE